MQCKKSTFIFSVESPLKKFARKYDGAHGHVMNFDLGMSHFYSRGITVKEICGGFTSGKVRLTSMDRRDKQHLDTISILKSSCWKRTVSDSTQKDFNGKRCVPPRARVVFLRQRCKGNKSQFVTSTFHGLQTADRGRIVS